MIIDSLADLVTAALERTRQDGILDLETLPAVSFDKPKRREHGDWATNVALIVAKGRGKPRDVAEAIRERIPDSDLVDRVEVAGPGFLNFHLSPVWLHDVVKRAADPAAGFGRRILADPPKVNVEFVSANPTGPINVVSGRHAAVGDAIAALLDATGCEVTREFYINDAGRQAWLFAESVEAHYLNHFGVDASVPEEGYRGEDVKVMALEIAEDLGDELVALSAQERRTRLRDIAIERQIAQMRATLERFGTTYNVWFSERALHESNAFKEVLQRLDESGFIENRDGATWFLSTKFGDDKDRVVIKANGDPTYLASDCAYLVDKFERGFDRLIYLWGADHHGTVQRLKGVAQALGFDPDTVEIALVQIVTLSAGEQTLKGSKRGGVYVKLDDLIDEVGADAARYTFLTRSIDAPLHFDIELAKEQAPENPVYYVQYAHARISSILRKAADQGVEAAVGDAPLDRLRHPAEDELMRKLASYEEVLIEAADKRAPQRVARYIEELASVFSGFYRDCHVLSDDAELTHARLALCVATRSVIADALGLLGVSAPERM